MTAKSDKHCLNNTATQALKIKSACAQCSVKMNFHSFQEMQPCISFMGMQMEKVRMLGSSASNVFHMGKFQKAF
jgi:hypothetical protein